MDAVHGLDPLIPLTPFSSKNEFKFEIAKALSGCIVGLVPVTLEIFSKHGNKAPNSITW